MEGDPELSHWLSYEDCQQPLAPGLPATHHRRWSLRVASPKASEPQGWYQEFVSQWHAYLATQTGLTGSLPKAGPVPRPQALHAEVLATGATSSGAEAQECQPLERRSPKRRQLADPLVRPYQHRVRGAPETPSAQPPPKRPRQGDLRGWLQPGSVPACEDADLNRWEDRCDVTMMAEHGRSAPPGAPT